MKISTLTINQLQQQLDKYQAQLAALELDDSYLDFEENRTLLSNFYKEKINEFTAEINKFKLITNEKDTSIQTLPLTSNH